MLQSAPATVLLPLLPPPPPPPPHQLLPPRPLFCHCRCRVLVDCCFPVAASVPVAVACPTVAAVGCQRHCHCCRHQNHCPCSFCHRLRHCTAFFTAVSTSSLFPLPTANVSVAQTLPLFPPPLHHCLGLRHLRCPRFCHGSHHCLKLPTSWLVLAKNGSSGHHGQAVGSERSILDNIYLF